MTYIIGLVVVGLIFLALNYFTDLKRTQKSKIVTIVIVLVVLATAFNYYSKNKDQHILEVAMKFNQGKTIRCKGVDINSSLYDLSTGTYTFIGKDKTPNAGNMISASTCE